MSELTVFYAVIPVLIQRKKPNLQVNGVIVSALPSLGLAEPAWAYLSLPEESADSSSIGGWHSADTQHPTCFIPRSIILQHNTQASLTTFPAVSDSSSRWALVVASCWKLNLAPRTPTLSRTHITHRSHSKLLKSRNASTHSSENLLELKESKAKDNTRKKKGNGDEGRERWR